MTLRIRPAIRRLVIAHARQARPNECCGFLLGRGQTVQFACPMDNVSPAPSRQYRIDDAAHIELRRALRQLAPPLEIVGLYHSHPAGPARPSTEDVQTAYYPEWVHLIVGFPAGRAVIYACRIRRGRVTRLPIISR